MTTNTIQNLSNLKTHFDSDNQSKFVTIVSLANLSSPSGNFPDSLISLVLGYTGDIDVKVSEMKILTGNIKKVSWLSETPVNNGRQILDESHIRYYCVRCRKIFNTRSQKIVFNHCNSDSHRKNMNKRRIHGLSGTLRHRLTRFDPDGTKIKDWKIERFDYPDSWKFYIRQIVDKRVEKSRLKRLKEKKESDKRLERYQRDRDEINN